MPRKFFSDSDPYMAHGTWVADGTHQSPMIFKYMSHRSNKVCIPRYSKSDSIILIFFIRLLGRDSSVGIATRYRLDGPGIESRWEARFSAPVQTVPGVHPASYTMDTGPFSQG